MAVTRGPQAFVYDVENSGVGDNYTTFVKAAAGGASGVECLLGANASLLNNVGM